MKKRYLLAAITGNALEFYDFTSYSYFAIQIGHTFFPSKNPFFELMASLITFGGGFVMRPVGGFVLGRYADRIGRRPAMLLCFAMMGLGVVGIALTPSYASIGIAAPVIVVLIRLLQGFALGGDVGPTTSFLMEAAGPERRGFFGSLQYVSQGTSTLVAGLIGLLLANILTADQLTSFGWRIAFLLGAAVVPVGLYIRTHLPETLHEAAKREGDDAQHPVWRTVVLGLLIIMGQTTAFYTISYLATYAQAFLNMKVNVAFASTLIFGVCNIIFSAIAGGLSDRIGRKPAMIWPRVLLIVAAYPCFLWLGWERTTLTLLAATAILTIFSQLSAGPGLVAITEALPPRMRSATMATIYAVGVAVFGGTTQPVVTWLIHASNNIYAPAAWIVVTNVICLVAMMLFAETAPVKTRAV